MTGPSSKDDGSQYRSVLWSDPVSADQVLSAMSREGKGFFGSAYQAFPQNPALSGRVLFFHHGSRLPRNKGKQALGWNDRPAANADCAQAS